MEGRRNLLRASENSQYGGPDGNDWLKGTGDVWSCPVHPKDIQQLHADRCLKYPIFFYKKHFPHLVTKHP